MYCGCPVVCSNVYGMKQQVGNAALMINPKSYKDIYKKIKTVLNNKKVKKKLINEGYFNLRKNINNPNICTIIEKLNF